MIKPFHTKLLLVLFLSVSTKDLWAQFAVENTWKIGQHNVSDGTYLKTTFSGYYSSKNFNINTQLQFDIINPQQRVFSGFEINASRDSVFTKFPTKMAIQYQLLPFSETLRESNISIIASKHHKGLSYALGLNFRTYTYTRQATEDYDIEERRYHENFGLLYNIGYTYTPYNNTWNVGLFFTNWDDFLINQDMNPFLQLRAQYQINTQWLLTAEGNYIKAGIFNGSSNYYGYFIKTGILWCIN